MISRPKKTCATISNAGEEDERRSRKSTVMVRIAKQSDYMEKNEVQEQEKKRTKKQRSHIVSE